VDDEGVQEGPALYLEYPGDRGGVERAGTESVDGLRRESDEGAFAEQLCRALQRLRSRGNDGQRALMGERLLVREGKSPKPES
jgi:hypothetical protein